MVSNKVGNGMLVGIFATCLTLGVAACSDFLQEDSATTMTVDRYFKNEQQAVSAVDALYTFLRSVFQSRDGYGEAPWISLELIVGHSSTLGSSINNNNMIRHNAATSDPVFRSMYVNLYAGIANANLCIQRIPDVGMDPARKASLLAQAYFFRAYFYYYLVRLYGEVPLITTPVLASSPLLYPKQSPIDAIYEVIVHDLKEAEAGGLPDRDGTGRISRGAVKAVLADVYLTMAGYPLNRGTAYYQLAMVTAGEVIATGAYSLFDDYAYLHDRMHKNQGEFILQVQYAAGIITNRMVSLVVPQGAGITRIEEQGGIVARREFVESYEPGDKRALEKQFFFTSHQARDGSGEVNFGEFALYKYWLEEAGGIRGDGNSDLNWTLMRLPEVLLIYAEAANEVAGPTEAAVGLVKRVRDRATLVTPEAGQLTQASFRDLVWKERYHELCFENKAYFDIKRTRKAYSLHANRFVDAVGFTNESGATMTEKYLLWPFPQTEMDANNQLEQNQGW
ncbi:RagB/SusD family nutrient uptake outer membrane protein [Parapedobacter koreensis]|uniref:Starch-binding associating with outer membrane n=1 Tax=Parapedobacter koreensis TaxID=332977 RepID=A0A1H7RQ20_9SPHI|nr:RagB/SusD family nutrient uptake outer membrane protein [Parapedobacter koreensis]SEL62390.1 Starch-binding associating with outer membrane [Parapedobacter koreensis]